MTLPPFAGAVLVLLPGFGPLSHVHARLLAMVKKCISAFVARVVCLKPRTTNRPPAHFRDSNRSFLQLKTKSILV